MLYYTILYYTTLYNTLLCYMYRCVCIYIYIYTHTLYFAILYYIILCYHILCYIICTVLSPPARFCDEGHSAMMQFSAQAWGAFTIIWLSEKEERLLPVEVGWYIFVKRCLARSTRCNTMSYLTTDADFSYTSRAKRLM